MTGIMEDARPANLAFLSDPEPGVFLLNVQDDVGALLKFRLTRNQVLNLNKDTADILLKAFK